jgi:hypothetical protein
LKTSVVKDIKEELMTILRNSRSLGVAAGLTFLFASSPAWAESAVQEPANFFATTPEFDPNAAGTKYSGALSIAYEFTADPVGCSLAAGFNEVRISNMFVVLSLQHGNAITPFNTDFRANSDPNPLIGKPATPSFCFIGEDHQIRFILEMIRTRIVPSLYAPCTARPVDPTQIIPGVSCPEFKIKSVSNMISSGHGSLRSDITIAVRD